MQGGRGRSLRVVQSRQPVQVGALRRSGVQLQAQQLQLLLAHRQLLVQACSLLRRIGRLPACSAVRANVWLLRC
jgi:hypothetical protein